MKIPRTNTEKFTTTPTAKGAYLLGLIWADGCVTKSNNIRVELKLDDAQTLEPIFDSTGKWAKSTITRKDGRQSLVFSTGNKPLASYLCSRNYKDKSNIATSYLDLPLDLQHYWWRGYSDGDGCFYIGSRKIHGSYIYSITGPYEQDWSFCEKLFDELEITYSVSKIANKEGHKKSYIRCTNKEGCKKIGNYLYQGETFGLERKHQKFKELFL